MAYQAFKETYFKKMVTTAREQAVNYAFGFNESGGPHVFILDTELPPAKLFGKVRAECGVKKGAYGTCRVEGSALMLTQDKKIKGLKQHLADLADLQGWRVKKFKYSGGDDENSAADEPDDDPQEPPRSEVEPGAAAARAPEPAPPDPSTIPDGSLAARAATIKKAVVVWNQTTVAATRELRKLQKAVMDLNDPRSKPVIKALEGILDRLDHVDEEASEAEAAARAGDEAEFKEALADVVGKTKAILASVQADPIIRGADDNPLVSINIGGTLTNALKAMLKALS